jgi:hypothetical protein
MADTDYGTGPTGNQYSGLQSGFAGNVAPYAQTLLGQQAAVNAAPLATFQLPGGKEAAQSNRIADVTPWQTNALGITQGATTSTFNPQTAQQYMSPYMQQVVDQQKKAATQDYMRGLPQLQAGAFQAGAGRGTRSALMQSEANRNLQNQLGGIQAQGLQNAYQQGQNQFNTEAQRQLLGSQQLYNLGSGMQQNKQNVLNALYQDFLEQRNRPQQGINSMAALLQGLPMADRSVTGYTSGTPMNAPATVMGGIGDIYNMMGGNSGPVGQAISGLGNSAMNGLRSIGSGISDWFSSLG